MSFHNHELLSEFVNRVISKPAKYILDVNGRQVFYSNRDYIDIKVYAGKIWPFITDFGSSMRLRGVNGRGMMPIQANPFRAPEVTLGFMWDTSADIWNLGAMASIGSVNTQKDEYANVD